MLTILLVAAGETEYDSQGRIQGTLDVPLSEGGRNQVLAAARSSSISLPRLMRCTPARAAAPRKPPSCSANGSS